MCLYNIIYLFILTTTIWKRQLNEDADEVKIKYWSKLLAFILIQHQIDDEDDDDIDEIVVVVVVDELII